MLKKIILVFAVLTFSASVATAQRSQVVKLGAAKVAVRGKLFNQIDYAFSNGKGRSVAYYFVDRRKNTLEITEVGYDADGGRLVASTIETFVCPLDRIDAESSYTLEMESDSVAGGKYFRLTLLSAGKGIDNLNFERIARSKFLETVESTAVNNVTVNIIDRKTADDWLRYFTGLKGGSR